jgi:ribose transport system substrate-binding protein
MNRLPRKLVGTGVLGLIAVSGAVVALLCGSSASIASTTNATASAASASHSSGAVVKGHKKVVLVTCEPNVFCHAYNVHLTALLKKAGVSVTQLSDNFDPTLQSQHMAEAIAQKPNAIILFASSAQAIVPEVERAQAAHIPVINVDAPLDAAGEKHIAFEVVADNPVLGQSAAENLVQGMQKAGYKSGNVMVVTGTSGTQIVEQRVVAFDRYMAKYPKYKIVSVQDGNWDEVQSSQLALQVLTKYQSKGGIQGAYGMADYQATGIIQAAEQLGITPGIAHGDLVVTASNCTPIGYAQMQLGKLWGNATQSPIHESTTAAGHVIEFLNGQKQPHTVIDQEQRFTLETYKSFGSLCSHWPTAG